jgi:hypothetical protein
MRLLFVILPIPLPTLLPKPTKAYKRGRKNKTLQASYDKKITELGVKPFLALTPDTSIARVNHSTFNQRPWQGIPLLGEGHYYKETQGGNHEVY